MTINFACPNCGKQLHASENAEGKSGKCPGCAEKLVVPRTSQRSKGPLGELGNIVKGSKLGEALLQWASQKDFATITRAVSDTTGVYRDPPSLEGILYPRGEDDILVVYRLSRRLIEFDKSRPEYWYMKGFALQPTQFPKGHAGLTDVEQIHVAQVKALRMAVKLRPDYFEALLDFARSAASFGATEENIRYFFDSLNAFNAAIRLCPAHETRWLKRIDIKNLRKDCLLDRWGYLIAHLTEAPDGTIEAKVSC